MPVSAGAHKLIMAILAVALGTLILTTIETLCAFQWVKKAQVERAASSQGASNLPRGAAARLSEFLRGPDALDALDRLSRAIPHSVDVLQITVDRSSVSIRGRADRAMAVYEGLVLQGFQDARFLQEVSKDPRSDLEMFAISAANPYQTDVPR